MHVGFSRSDGKENNKEVEKALSKALDKGMSKSLGFEFGTGLNPLAVVAAKVTGKVETHENKTTTDEERNKAMEAITSMADSNSS